jgi:hypothetical protein
MKRCQIDCDLLTEFDLFGKEPEFFYKGKAQRTSWFGRIFSVFYIVLYVAFVIYKLVRMIEKVDIDFYETYAFSGIPTIKLNNNLFYGGFSIGGIIDETIYFPVVRHYVEKTVNGVRRSEFTDVPLTKCTLDKFGSRFQHLFADKNLDNLYCMKEVDDYLTGYSNLDEFSYYYIAIMPCIGYNPNMEACQDIVNVTKFFQQTYLEFKLQDVVMTPKDYDEPSIPRNMDITGPVFSFLYQSIYTYLQIVNLETDQDWLGFEGLSDIKKEQFLRYDESWIIAAPSPHMQGLQALTPICDITIQLSAKVLTTKRTNTKLIEVLGDVGGLMEVVWSAFNLLSIFVTDLLYDIDIVNTLFSFDLTKKIVIMKKGPEELVGTSNEDEINIYNNKKTKIKFSNEKIIKPPIENYEDKKIEEEIKPIKSIESFKNNKRKKIRNKKVMTQPNRRTEERNNFLRPHMNFSSKNVNVNKMNEIERQTIISNNLMVPKENSEERQNTENAKKNQILDEIKINKFFIVFAFCCIRKRKNVNNYVLEEGLGLIAKRLDILNIFKRLYYDEKIQKNYINETEELAMTDICKDKIG